MRPSSTITDTPGASPSPSRSQAQTQRTDRDSVAGLQRFCYVCIAQVGERASPMSRVAPQSMSKSKANMTVKAPHIPSCPAHIAYRISHIEVHACFSALGPASGWTAVRRRARGLGALCCACGKAIPRARASVLRGRNGRALVAG